jgi:hypothetical protein
MAERELTEEQKQRNYERSIFRRFLKRFRVCKNKEQNLQARLNGLMDYNTYSGQKLSGMPSSGKKSNTPLEFQVELEDLRARICIQNERSVEVYLSVADVFRYLDQDSDIREVLERKYIDCQSEFRICRDMNISRSTLYRYASRGLDDLLTYDKIRITLAEYAKQLEIIDKENNDETD